MTAHFVHMLDDLQRRSLRMASAVEDMVLEACEAVTQLDQTLAHRIISRDQDIDKEEVEVETEALRLMTLFQPMGTDMRQLCTILKVNNDLERIADCAVNMAERASHLDREGMSDAHSDLKQIHPIVRRMLHDAIQAYAAVNQPVAEKVRSEDDLIDALYEQFIKRIVEEAARSPGVMATQLDILSIAKNLERIADHATNIAEDVIYMATGKIIRHRSG